MKAKTFHVFLFFLTALICCDPSPAPLVDTASHPAPSAQPESRVTRMARILSTPQPSPDTPIPDARTEVQLAQAACQGRCVGKSIPKLMGASQGSQPIFPSSWRNPTWAIDPLNSIGCASDTNSGTSTTCVGGCAGNVCTSGIGPLVSWQELNVHRWGCGVTEAACPRLQQATTINILSNQPQSDTIYTRPALELGAYEVFQCQLGSSQQVGSGTLGANTSKNRATNTALSSTLVAGLLPGEIIQNTTHPSLAWTYRNTSANVWKMSQPLLAFVVPTLSLISPPTEVDTWTVGDAFTAYNLTTINLVDVEPQIAGFSAAESNGVYFYHCNASLPGAPIPSFTTIGPSVHFVESSVSQLLYVPFFAINQFVNTYLGASLTQPQFGAYDSSFTLVFGGVFGAFNAGPTDGASPIIDADTIVGGTVSGSNFYNINGEWSTVYLDTGAVLAPDVGGVLIAAQDYGGPFIYGPGSIDASATSRIFYPAGAGAGAAAFLISGGLKMNGQTKGCIAQPGVAALGSCNTTCATGGNLDTANGATVGCCGPVFGGAFCNYGP